MSPAYLTTVAERLHSKRATLALAAVAGVVVLLAIGYLLPQAVPVLAPLAGPLVFLPWMIFCACTWFHPDRGSLRLKTGGRLATIAREGIRWYAAVFVAVSVVFAVAVWPTMAILWL